MLAFEMLVGAFCAMTGGAAIGLGSVASADWSGEGRPHATSPTVTATAQMMRATASALIAPAAVHPTSHAEQRQTSDEQRQGSWFRHRAGRGRILHSDRRRS